MLVNAVMFLGCRWSGTSARDKVRDYFLQFRLKF